MQYGTSQLSPFRLTPGVLWADDYCKLLATIRSKRERPWKSDLKVTKSDQVSAHPGNGDIVSAQSEQAVEEAAKVNPVLFIMLAFLILFPIFVKFLPYGQNVQSYLEALYK